MKYILAKLIGHKEVRDLKPEECIFCQIANGHHPAAGTILYEDETLVCFPDYRPCGVVHLQIVPKRHILNVDSLQPGNQQHLDLATSMLGLGQRMVEAQSPGALASGRAKFGYHLEPFHSVLHLQYVANVFILIFFMILVLPPHPAHRCMFQTDAACTHLCCLISYSKGGLD